MGKPDNFNSDDLKPVIENLIDQVKNQEDPDVLNAYKKAFKKQVPFALRSWVTAYMLKEMGKKKGGNRRTIADGASIFVSIGRNRKVFPKDLVHLFVNTGKVDRDSIGEIKILDNYSFITISRSAAESAIDNLDGIDYRGRKLTVNFAKKKAGS
ncbi:MAG: DbpA RNA binding domain-containing protein [Spirochaetales bacterium]|nr:DbpA RNA binding domain-containing protein [Spirochaetales bacterium]